MSDLSTLDRILSAALALFLEKGFSGASISMIAKRAGINQSLIYHYFKDKLDLWHHVKQDFLQKHAPEIDYTVTPETSFEDFLANFIDARLTFYLENPEALRMMNWQRLEGDASLQSSTNLGPLEGAIYKLQQFGKVHYTIPPDFISAYISTAVTALLYDHMGLVKAKTDRLRYQQILVKSLCNVFAVESENLRSDRVVVFY